LLRQAAGRRSVLHLRAADLRHRGRGDRTHPVDRHHPTVHVRRWFVPGRHLAAGGVPATDRRRGPAADAATGGPARGAGQPAARVTARRHHADQPGAGWPDRAARATGRRGQVNAPLRRVGVVARIMFGLLFAHLNWGQAYRAGEYRNSPYNERVQIAEYQRERGLILVGRDAQAVTGNVETDGRLRYQRTYPLAERYAHVVGYKPVNGEATGIEWSEDEFLAGTA